MQRRAGLNSSINMQNGRDFRIYLINMHIWEGLNSCN